MARITIELSDDLSSREARLRRSLKRLGFELAEADAGRFYIRREGSKVSETPDLFGLDLASIEQWIRGAREAMSHISLDDFLSDRDPDEAAKLRIGLVALERPTDGKHQNSPGSLP